VYGTARIVRPGETISSRTLERFSGGKGLNQSTALARAGASVRHIGRIGVDGLFLKDGLEAEGVDVSGILAGDEPTGHAVIQVADDGENAIVLFGGANQSWDSSDISRILDAAEPGDVLLMQNEINGTVELMEAAAAAGMHLALNPAPMGSEVFRYPLELLRWLVVNEIEGRELSGVSGRGEDSENAVVTALLSRYPDTVVVMTLGKKGALRGDRKGLFRSRFPDVGNVLDTTGAGDTFMGYWLAGEVAGLDAESGLLRACAAGALAVTRRGAATAIPKLLEVEALIKGYNKEIENR